MHLPQNGIIGFDPQPKGSTKHESPKQYKAKMRLPSNYTGDHCALIWPVRRTIHVTAGFVNTIDTLSPLAPSLQTVKLTSPETSLSLGSRFATNQKETSVFALAAIAVDEVLLMPNAD